MSEKKQCAVVIVHSFSSFEVGLSPEKTMVSVMSFSTRRFTTIEEAIMWAKMTVGPDGHVFVTRFDHISYLDPEHTPVVSTGISFHKISEILKRTCLILLK